ncbi:MAG TPA: TIR domain-containing protein [Thermoanaerobaculia bacterium]
MRRPAKVFVSYAHEDEDLLQELEAHLKLLQHQRVIELWHDRRIPPGEDWKDDIDARLEEADWILFLVSADFISSRYCWGVEMKRAMERHEAGAARAIPILLRPCDTTDAPFMALQGLPPSFQPITTWPDRDSAWESVAKGLRKLLSPDDPLLSDDLAGPDAPFLAPDPPRVFVGRSAEVSRLEAILQTPGSLAVIRGGLGGSGKTALAAYVARRLRSWFPGGILWARVDIESEESILRSFLAVLDPTLLSVFEEHNSLDARVRLVKSVLAKRRCLIVLDNVESSSQVERLVALAGPSSVLLTTRYGLASIAPDAAEIRLGGLERTDSKQLLRELLARSGADYDDAAADDLHETLGGLPLAIRIAAGIVNEMRWHLREYLEKLRSSDTLAWLDSEDGTLAVRKSFALSYENLVHETARACFHAMGISLEARADAAWILGILGGAPDELQRALLTLASRGMIEIQRAEPAGSIEYRLHPLMARYARELLKQAGRFEVYQERAGLLYRRRLSQWNEAEGRFIYGGTGTPADVRNGFLAARHFLQAGFFTLAEDVLVGIADIMTQQGRDRALTQLIRELESEVRDLHPWLRLYLGGYILEGKSERPLQEGASVLEDLARRDDPKLASAALIELARYKVRQAEFDEAGRLFQQSEALKSSMAPPDVKGIAFILNEMARLAAKQDGNHPRAIELHGKALELQKREGDIKGMSYSLRRIGAYLLYHLQDLEAALRAFEESQRLAEAAGAKLGQVTALIEIAEVHARREHYAAAIEELERALGMARECEDRRAEAKVLKRLGNMYSTVELYGRALQALRKSHEIFGMIGPTEKETEQVARSLQRAAARVSHLEGELAACEREIERLAASGDQRNSDLRREMRILYRRKRKILSQLGRGEEKITLGRPIQG